MSSIVKYINLYFVLSVFIFFNLNICLFGYTFNTDSLSSRIKQITSKAKSLENLFPDSAIFYYKSGLQILDENQLTVEETIEKIKILNKLGLIFHNQSKYSFAMDYYSKALTEAKNITNDTLTADAFFNIAEIKLENGNYADAINFYYKAKDVYANNNNMDGTFWSNIGLGIVYRRLGNTDLSKEHYKLAMQIAEDENKIDYVAICYNNLGNLLKQAGDYNQAIKYLQFALKSFEKLGEEKYISDCLESIGEVYSEIGNYERAIEYFNKSAEIVEILGDKYRLLSRYANIANSFAELSDNQNALMYFSKTIELAQSIGDKSRLSEIFIAVSNYYRSNNDFDNAYLNLNKSIAISNEIGDTVNIISSYNILSELMILKNNIPAAYNSALKAYQLSSKKNLRKHLAIASLNLSKILEIQGNFKDAFFYFKIYNQTKDDLLNEGKIKILEETEAKYNVEKIKRENLQLENTTLVKEEKLKRRNTYIFILLIFVVLSLISGGWYFYKKKKELIFKTKNSVELKKEIDLLSDQLNEKNRVLTSKALLISQNNEILKNAVISIEDYLNNNLNDKNSLKKLKKQLQEIYEEKSWDNFLQHFEQVHPRFYNNLMNKSAELSSMEQKICAFIKMNLNSKEISQITGQTTKAIEVMRTRIRKKLDVPHDESLTKVIQSI